MRKAIIHLKTADPVLRGIIEKVGPYRITYIEPDFDSIVRAIVFQQLSGKAARTIFGRLQGAAGKERLTPGSILKLTEPEMRAVGLSQQKTAYIRDLAAAAGTRSINIRALAGLPDHEVHEVLTSCKGIGPWTVHMFLIFALRRPDVLPAADLGIRAAVRKAYGLAGLPTPSEVEELGRAWRPYCSIASWYLWRSLEAEAGM